MSPTIVRFCVGSGLALALLVIVVFVLVTGGCGYRMQPADYTTLENLAPNCAANVALLAEAGPRFAQERSTDRVCNCGARGILARAGQPLPDAGREGCPQ